MDASNKNEKPKTVATIDVNLHTPTHADWLTESVDDHLKCVLCGESLEFKHKTNFVEQMVHEDAQCPSCGVRTRQNAYRLQ